MFFIKLIQGNVSDQAQCSVSSSNLQGLFPHGIGRAFCWMLRMTNSAGLSGANPTMIRTIPAAWSAIVVVYCRPFGRVPIRRAVDVETPTMVLFVVLIFEYRHLVSERYWA